MGRENARSGDGELNRARRGKAPTQCETGAQPMSGGLPIAVRRPIKSPGSSERDEGRCACVLRQRSFDRESFLQPNPDMKIHEYQAKAILAKYGVPVPRGESGVHAWKRPKRRPRDCWRRRQRGGEGADPRRRPRQGRRREGGQDAGRGEAAGRDKILGMRWSRTRPGRRARSCSGC